MKTFKVNVTITPVDGKNFSAATVSGIISTDRETGRQWAEERAVALVKAQRAALFPNVEFKYTATAQVLPVSFLLVDDEQPVKAAVKSKGDTKEGEQK